MVNPFTSYILTGQWIYQNQIFDAGPGRDITWLTKVIQRIS